MDVNKFLNSGAIFSKAGSPKVIISWGQAVKSSKIKSYPSYYHTDFYLEEASPFVNYENNIILDKSDLRKKLKEINPVRDWLLPEKKIFNQYFEKIKKSNFDKMVPIVYETSMRPLLADELSSCLFSLLSLKHEGSLYGFWDQQKGIIGYTPEVLFKIEDNCFETMALAGTASADSSKNLLEDAKEMHEHGLVVEDIKRQLSAVANKIETSQTKEVVLKSLKHLKTLISAQLDSGLGNQLNNQLGSKKKYEDLVGSMIKSLHPTAALGLFPRVESWKPEMKKIRQKLDREIYGAPFGVLLEDSLEIAVAIRNLQWDSRQLYIGSGCGVVEQSDCGKEWTELVLKRNSVKESIGMKEL